MRDYRYYQSAFAGIPKPFAFVDLDLLEQNAEQIGLQSNGKPIRIASKSIRSVGILKHLLQLDDCLSGLMCFSAPEALHLCAAGFDDLLLGYPVWEKSWLIALGEQIQQGRSLTLMIDSVSHVEHLEQIAREQGVIFPVCLDIDMSSDILGLHFGVWRSPLRSLEQAVALASRVASSKHLKLDGIMGYEAQIAGVGDRYPRQFFKNSLIRLLKQQSVKEVASQSGAGEGDRRAGHFAALRQRRRNGQPASYGKRGRGYRADSRLRLFFARPVRLLPGLSFSAGCRICAGNHSQACRAYLHMRGRRLYRLRFRRGGSLA